MYYSLVGAGLEVKERREYAHYEQDGTWQYPTVDYRRTGRGDTDSRTDRDGGDASGVGPSADDGDAVSTDDPRAFPVRRGPKRPETSRGEPRMPIPWNPTDPSTLHEQCRAHTKFHADCGGW